MLAISRLNYPGAQALEILHAAVPTAAGNATTTTVVHMDTLSCMTGITRFLEDGRRAEGWVYDKTEEEQTLLDPLFWDRMDYALAERPERVIGAWEAVGTVEAFAGFGVVRLGEGGGGGKGLAFGEILGRVREGGKWKGLWIGAGELAGWVEQRLRRGVTGVWWVRVKMEPRIRVLRRQKGVMEEMKEEAGGVEHDAGSGEEGDEDGIR